jgi:hypothetical protein
LENIEIENYPKLEESEILNIIEKWDIRRETWDVRRDINIESVPNFDQA